jgi:general secretion pathway protein G
MRRWTAVSGRERGFTLVELVVVMTIIAILAGALALQIGNRVQHAKRTRALQDVATMKSALELYRADNGDYPTSQQGLDALYHKPSSPPVPTNWERYLDKPIQYDPWLSEYIYRCPGQEDPDGYDLISYGKDRKPGGADNDADITNMD